MLFDAVSKALNNSFGGIDSKCSAAGWNAHQVTEICTIWSMSLVGANAVITLRNRYLLLVLPSSIGTRFRCSGDTCCRHSVGRCWKRNYVDLEQRSPHWSKDALLDACIWLWNMDTGLVTFHVLSWNLPKTCVPFASLRSIDDVVSSRIGP